MRVDLHNLPLETAKQVIKNTISQARKQNTNMIEVVHGFNNGTKIKTYLLNKKIREDNPEISNVQSSPINNGITYIYLYTKIK